MVCSTFFKFLLFNLRNYIFQSAKKCEITSFYMTSLHVDLNEAAKCVDIIPLTLLASLSHLRTLVQNGDDIWSNLRRFINQFMKVAGIKTWNQPTIDLQQLVRLVFNNDFINPGLVLQSTQQSIAVDDIFDVSENVFVEEKRCVLDSPNDCFLRFLQQRRCFHSCRSP